MLEKLMFCNVDVSNAVQEADWSMQCSTVLKRAGAKGSLNAETPL
jgi:hypothetical protein